MIFLQFSNLNEWGDIDKCEIIMLSFQNKENDNIRWHPELTDSREIALNVVDCVRIAENS